MEIMVGIVTNYFSKIGVCTFIIETTSLRIGDNLRIEGRDTEITQKVSSMQKEYSNIEEAHPGQLIGLKVVEPVKKGNIIYKLID